MYPLFLILFPYGSFQSIESTSLGYKVGPYHLFYRQQCVYVSLSLPLHPSTLAFPLGNHKLVFYICGSISILL